MRIIVALMAVVAIGCTNISGESAAAQAVAGPGGVTVSARSTDQLAVSWSVDPAASGYQVFQSAAGGAAVLVANVFDSGGGSPATSYIATGLTSGTYCYAVASTYPDGTTSSLGAAGCGTTSGGTTTSAVVARTVSGLLARPMDDAVPAARLSAGEWHFTGTGWMEYALPVNAGEMIAGFNWWASKPNHATVLHTELFAQDSTTGDVFTLGEDRFSAQGTSGSMTLSATGLTIMANARTTYILGVQEGDGVPDGTTTFSDAELLVQPRPY